MNGHDRHVDIHIQDSSGPLWAPLWNGCIYLVIIKRNETKQKKTISFFIHFDKTQFQLTHLGIVVCAFVVILQNGNEIEEAINAKPEHEKKNT